MREVMDTTRQRLTRIRGEVFHVIAGDDQLLRFRVEEDGNLSLDRQFRSLNLRSLVNMPKRMLEAGKEAKEKVVEAGLRKASEAKGRARRKMRKVVTGDPDKRIRDHFKEVPQVKMIDKLSFTFGVLTICGLEWLALRHADWFPIAYYVIMSALLVARFFLYRADKYELFMIDFCYFMNASVMLQTALYPNHLLWFKANYVMSLGPLMVAIILWKNSLVFHSLDKLTSFFLHAMPPLTMHLFRFGVMKTSAIKEDDYLTFSEWFLVPLGLYLSWQLGYSFLTEVVLSSRLEQDKDLITSLRYLANDKKNGFRNMIVKILIKTGVQESEEDFNPDSRKAKTVFIVSQIIYTLITMIPTGLLYSSYEYSCCYFVFVFGWGTWNGASYYMEVFSERYRLQFVKAEKDENDKLSENTEEYSADSETDDEDISEFESFENALEQLDPQEHSHLYQSILAIVQDDSDALLCTSDIQISMRREEDRKEYTSHVETPPAEGEKCANSSLQPEQDEEPAFQPQDDGTEEVEVSVNLPNQSSKSAKPDTTEHEPQTPDKEKTKDSPSPGSKSQNQDITKCALTTKTEHKEIETREIESEKRDIEPKTRAKETESLQTEPAKYDVEPKTRVLETETPDLEPKPRDLEPKTRDLEPQTRDLEPKTRDLKPETRVLEPETRDLEPDPELISKLLADAATQRVGKSSSSSSETGAQATPESENSWEDLTHPAP